MIGGFGHGRNRGWRNQNRVESHCLCSTDSHSRGHDFDAAVGKDRPDFGSANAFVNILHYPPIVPDGFKEGSKGFVVWRKDPFRDLGNSNSTDIETR